MKMGDEENLSNIIFQLALLTLRLNHNILAQLSFVWDIVLEICQQIQTLNFLGLVDAQKNYTFKYSYTHITFNYNITTTYNIGTGLVGNSQW